MGLVLPSAIASVGGAVLLHPHYQSQLSHVARVRGSARFPKCKKQGRHFHHRWGVGPTLECGGQQGAGSALLQQARGRAGSVQCFDINMASGSILTSTFT